MPEQTQVELDALKALVQRYPFLVSVGSVSLAPLAAAPKIEGEVETQDVTLYESGGEVEASYLRKNNVKLTFETYNVAAAMTLLTAFAKGDDVLATSNSKAVTMVPITDQTGTPSFTFGNCFLQPGLSVAPGEGSDPNKATLVFMARPVAATGKPCVYA